MTVVVGKDDYLNDVQAYRYEPAWVREIKPKAREKMTRYEVIVAGKKIAVKYTRHSAQLLADGLNKLMQ